MIEKQNFRFRGPIESINIDNVMKETITTINTVIAKAQKLVDDTTAISTKLIADTKRRGIQ